MRRCVMVKLALFVKLEAKPGKEKDVESFLSRGLPLVQQEPATIAWFGIRLGPSTFGIFDAFPDAGRRASSCVERRDVSADSMRMRGSLDADQCHACGRGRII
jgi:hypothetical protein